MARRLLRPGPGWWIALAAVGLSCETGRVVGREGGRPADEGCSDRDDDGFGVGPDCHGPDCNDFVPTIHTDEQCEAFCADGAPAPGCPCDALEPAPCYVGEPATLGVGVCRGGITWCDAGTWVACAGEVLPRDEVCNERDDDCDAVVDDGVLSECGTCGECERTCVGPECGGWGEMPTWIVETSEGWLTLDGHAVMRHVIWPSSSATGEIFRVNTQTFEIEGGFFTGPNREGGPFNGGDSPSRSAVDDDGNVIIANRAFTAEASFTKIAADPATCPDVNGNGRIDTSTGWDDKRPFFSHEDWDDECVLWHTPVGVGVDSNARAIAIHTERSLDGVAVERGWVGLYGEERFVQFDVVTGELTGTSAPTPGCTPYGGAIDRDGWLWVTCFSPFYGRFDTSRPEESWELLEVPEGARSFRVIVDENNVPWIAGEDVWRWDRDLEALVGVGFESPGGALAVGNIASDGRGSIWAATYTNHDWVYRIDNDEEMDYRVVPMPNGVLSYGIAVDFDGHVWAFDYTNGRTAVIDVKTEESMEVLEDCGGYACLSIPYIRGDITGLQRRNAQNPSGSWSRVFEGCEDGDTDWKRVVASTTTPEDTEVIVSARTADTLGAVPWTVLGSASGEVTFELDDAFAEGEPDGPVIEVQVFLYSRDLTSAPFLRALEVQWACTPILL